MRERPVNLTAAEVRAILDGRKTQMRMVVTPQPAMPTDRWHLDGGGSGRWMATGPGINGGRPQTFPWTACPLGQPGDWLWGKETWGLMSRDGSECSIGYAARLPAGKTLDDTDGGLDVRTAPAGFEMEPDPYRWRPSIHMPLWVSRILLEISDVRVQRLQEITEEDARAEGINRISHGREGYYFHHERTEPHPKNRRHADDAFQQGWDSRAKPGSTWADNPWVWAITFRRVE